MLFFAFGIVFLLPCFGFLFVVSVRPAQQIDANRGLFGQPIFRYPFFGSIIHFGLLLSPFVPLEMKPVFGKSNILIYLVNRVLQFTIIRSQLTQSELTGLALRPGWHQFDSDRGSGA
jgi:hypothetical protein